MSSVPDESPHWDGAPDGEEVSRDLRQQIEAAKARMHDLRDSIAATGRSAPEDSAARAA